MKEQYRAHVKKIAEEMGCEIKPCEPMSAMMYVEFGYIEAPVIEDQIHYLTNLHELGHVFHNHTQGRPPHTDKKFYFDNGVLKSEAQAWEYALDNCLDPIQDESRYFMWDYCLGSYYKDYLTHKGKTTRIGNGNRHHVLFSYDHPEKYFESIVERIQSKLTDFDQKYVGRY